VHTQDALLAAAGLRGWSRLRHGHNGVHRSPDGTLIAKVYGEASRCEVDVHGADLARAAGALVPDLVDLPHPRVAIWRCIPTVSEAPGAQALTGLARDLGRLATVPAAEAPVHWLDNVTLRAAALDRWAGDPDVSWLAGELRAVAASDVAQRAPLVFQHGDLSMSNLVHDGDRLHLIDFETIRAAPREWDLAALRITSDRYGALAPDALRIVFQASAADAGPADPEILACCLRAKDLLNASWLFLMRELDPAMVAEARRRVRSLRDRRPHRWSDLGVLAGQPTWRGDPTSRESTSDVENESSEV
jgi:hypothetical protein